MYSGKGIFQHHFQCKKVHTIRDKIQLVILHQNVFEIDSCIGAGLKYLPSVYLQVLVAPTRLTVKSKISSVVHLQKLLACKAINFNV